MNRRIWNNEIALLIAATLLCLLPFVTKPFHIDDPLFIWGAEQIHKTPLDFYGGTVNWNGWELPMWEVQKNPPLASYYIAGVALLFGWGEVAMHLAFMLPAILAVWGTYNLARRFGSKPWVAGLVTLFTPVFLVSSTNVMCDVMMLAFWVWALLFWMRGFDGKRAWNFVVSGILIGLSALTKYFGASLIPLLAAYSIFRHLRGNEESRGNSPGWWSLVYLAIPVALLGAFNWWSIKLYGTGLLGGAASYAESYNALLGQNVLAKFAVGLSFTGGCLLPVLFFAPVLWSKRMVAGLVLLSLLAIVPLLLLPDIGGFALLDAEGRRWRVIFHFAVFLFAAFGVITLAIGDFWKTRGADSLLLGAWIAGTFVFAVWTNWAINGRSLLAMAPAVAILVIRALPSGSLKPAALVLPLAASAIVALLVARADFVLADSARTASREVQSRFPKEHLRFAGHWGFQYYMLQSNVPQIEVSHLTLHPGDLVVQPETTAVRLDFKETAVMREQVAGGKAWGTTLQPEAGAGFYAHLYGVLPFVFGPVELSGYSVHAVNMAVDLFQENELAAPHFASAQAALNNGRTDEALHALTLCLRAQPTHWKAHYELALLKINAGNNEEAVAHLEKVIEAQPAAAEAHYRLGLVLLQARDLHGTVRHWRETVRLQSDRVEALNNLAWILATDPDPSIRDGAEAIRLAESACALLKEPTASYLGTLAAAYAETGRFEDARHTMERAIQAALSAQDLDLATRLRERMDLFRAGKPFRAS